MFVRHRTWRSSSFLAAALAVWGESRPDGEEDVPLQLAHVLRTPRAAADQLRPGEELVLGLTTPQACTAQQRLVVWERLESDGDRHTLLLRGGLVAAPRDAQPEAQVVFRPTEGGVYRVVDDATGTELHRFTVS